MPTVVYTKPTGNSGTMKIEDDGEYVSLWLLGVNQLIPEVPWAYIADGIVSDWRSFRLEANLAWQKLTTLRILTPQTVTLRLGASGNTALGGPTDFEVDIEREPIESIGTGTVRIKVGDVHKYAIPYVKDDGVWKQADPWARLAGEWNRAY